MTPSGVRTFFASGGHKTVAKQVWFYFISGTTWPGYKGTFTNLQIVLNTLLNTCQNFPAQKIPEIKNLEYPSPPRGCQYHK